MNEQQQQHQQQRKGEKISVVAHKNANDYFMIFSVEKSEFENILKRPTDYNIFASVLYAAHFSWPKMEQNKSATCANHYIMNAYDFNIRNKKLQFEQRYVFDQNE